MKVLVIFDHPRRTSFCGAVLDAFVGGLQDAIARHQPAIETAARLRHTSGEKLGSLPVGVTDATEHEIVGGYPASMLGYRVDLSVDKTWGTRLSPMS
ncbi:NAD(P)H-dependent oxidoreductase [Sinorhizobium mexicanum]|uniref:NAD(P)H-dependent oxidoreductase n=1 Tax=Sinorhizobium mexicanum TaxID=375549 RepID=A0A859QJZ2_9HYPH|nr:NAD(P)H-dependent oxidoreductase [Sinorhizobium mexicanum]MBP1881886.1 hypothetical protein [Sinorhizobium mexicanum]QLL61627.1 NAD(P)H-dependent oxidoreductase [Sinorhizobium mexicanum]